MKIVVCIKQVPDTSEVKLDSKTGRLMREGVPSIINPDDKSGIEAALRIKEETGGSVAVVSMGPPQADFALREALAMGCDEAYLITAKEFAGSDTFATAKILAGALGKIGFDLIITGRQAIDGDTAQVGPQIAENLNIPQVSYVEDIEVNGCALTVKRQFEDRYHILEVKTPCLLTALSELAPPRYMHVRGTVEAYEKEVQTLGFEDLAGTFDPSCIGLAGSPTSVYKSFGKKPKGAGEMHKNLSADEAVSLIISKMAERHII
ncbi:MAG: electron transfer flavoprotein subunit beta/FixA family protein [Clostridiales bacterium]|nr:electron transfer flavoprotein subunit beta/FixA family protein [Clostridiales bacterium]